MLIIFTGSLGQGKTLSMSILGTLLARAGGLNLYSNYGLKDAQRIYKMDHLLNMEKGVMCFDEAHMSIDSRTWKDNIKLSHFMLQTRKKDLIVMMTTQAFGQVDLRVRGITDYVVACRKKPAGFWLQFINWQEQTLCHRRLIPSESVKRYYQLYDTKEIVNPIVDERKKGV